MIIICSRASSLNWAWQKQSTTHTDLFPKVILRHIGHIFHFNISPQGRFTAENQESAAA